MNATYVIKKPLLTEKSTIGMSEMNIYTFVVDRTASKDQIKAAIEEMYKVKVSSVRTQLSKRDKGVCAKCGVDTLRAESRARVARASWEWHAKHGMEARLWRFRRSNPGSGKVPNFLLTDRWGFMQPRVAEARRARLMAMEAEGWNVERRLSWWEADHIVPVAEGGGQCGPENYRTLCCRCHLVVTNELRQRLRKAKGPVAPHDNKQAGLPGSGMGLDLPGAFNCGSAADRQAAIHSGAPGSTKTEQPK